MSYGDAKSEAGAAKKENSLGCKGRKPMANVQLRQVQTMPELPVVFSCGH